MENNLYRIEVIMHHNLPSIDTTGLLVADTGVSYVKIHPVKLTAKPKSDVVHKCAHGHWMEKKLTDQEYGLTISKYECSKCTYLVDNKTNYCPNCGAKMEEDDE